MKKLSNIVDYLNVSLDRPLEPGRAFHAYPPFCSVEAAEGVTWRDVPIDELVEFHADFAMRIRDLPEGRQISAEVIK